ncbi:helix-turn-helix domain-containing protein [Rhodobacterales bacterium HKCCE2091]|nr:helix-turn-helix domain-containing protein [Rhodobacterales bacterium HKCCE2091]
MRILNTDVFEIYRDGDGLVLPELHGIGFCDTTLPRLGGPRTDGLDFLEIGYLERGSIEWLTEDGLEEAEAGSIVIDWPGDWQGGVDAIIHPSRRFWVRFDLNAVPTLPGLGPRTGRELAERIRAMATRHFRASPGIGALFEQILSQQRAPGLFAEEMSRAAFHQILFTMVNDHRDVRATRPSAPVRAALAYIETHLAEKLQVAEVARHVGLSAGYFHEIFLRETGRTPARHQIDRRILAARTRMVTGADSITELSLDLGFSSSQYFATVFKRHVGLTPGDYRRLRRGDMDEASFNELAWGTHPAGGADAGVSARS